MIHIHLFNYQFKYSSNATKQFTIVHNMHWHILQNKQTLTVTSLQFIDIARRFGGGPNQHQGSSERLHESSAGYTNRIQGAEGYTVSDDVA